MSKLSIYHNPRCSKSREALALLKEHELVPKIRLYLKNPPSIEELSELLKKLNIKARDLIRTQESLYRELNMANPKLTEAQLIKLMAEHPILIERPIVMNDSQAVIARPAEKLLELL